MKALFSEERIHNRVDELGREISRDFLGKELILIGVLNGGFIFTADLCRSIAIPHEIDFIGASSYGDGTKSSGKIEYTKFLKRTIKGKSVLIVEDIVDTGKTLEFLVNDLMKHEPLSLQIAALFWKKEKANPHLHVDYYGFEIGDEYLVGYGLDHAGMYRNLPYVASLEPDDSKDD
ncbi:hypoxanthine phosphoribosyltransferase [Leptospira sp. 'Mane']|uniref:hypoxanthine phosphoribosyltransferase n=1 Tax=Leptospira sp. 'Mane' TaxID=3387407 RepID=UPI00398B994B